MDTIRIELEGERIALTLRREAGDLARVRRISLQDAFALGLLLTGEIPNVALNFEVGANLSLQIVNAPYEEAFLSLPDLRDSQTLVVALEGALIREVGLCLTSFYWFAKQSASITASPAVFIRPVSHCYLEDSECR